MRLIIILSVILLFKNDSKAQFLIKPDTDVFVENSLVLYINKDFNNKGTLTLANDGGSSNGGLTKVIFDGDYDNSEGTVTLNNNALRFGAGGTNSTDKVTLTFNASGQTTSRLILNKTGEGTATTEGDGSLDVLDTLRMDAGQLIGLDHVTLKSTANKTAVVGQSDPGAEASVTVERYYTARRAFRFLSPSVTTTTTTIHENWQEGASSYTDDPSPGYGTHITGLAPAVDVEADEADDQNGGFDYTKSGNSSLFLFDNENSAWMPFGIGEPIYNNTDDTTIDRNIPYRIMIRGNRSMDITQSGQDPTETILRTKGELHFGDYNFDGGDDNSFALNTNSNTFSMLVNPYHSVVDFNNAGKTNLTATLYIWDPTLNTRGGYASVTYDTGINAQGSDANQYLQPSQAFFVQTNSSGNSTISIEESNKSKGVTQTQTFSTLSFLRVKLFGISSGEEIHMDGALFVFSPSYLEGKDNWDALRFPNPDEELSIVSHNPKGESRNLMANYIPEPQDMKVFPLQIDKYTSSSYKLSFEKEFVNAEVVLEDTYTNEMVMVEQGVTYDFNVDANDPESSDSRRFNLIFNPVSLSTNDVSESGLTLYPNPVWPEDDIIKLKFSSHRLTSDARYLIYDLLGKRIQGKQLLNSGSNLEAINISNLSTGVYIIKIEDGKSSWTRKIVKQ